jgi:hypothetical protein
MNPATLVFNQLSTWLRGRFHWFPSATIIGIVHLHDDVYLATYVNMTMPFASAAINHRISQTLFVKVTLVLTTTSLQHLETTF